MFKRVILVLNLNLKIFQIRFFEQMIDIESEQMDTQNRQIITSNEDDPNTNISALDRQVWSEIVGQSSSSDDKKQSGVQIQNQFQDFGGTNGSVNTFEINPQSISNRQNIVDDGSGYAAGAERSMMPMKQSDRPLTSHYGRTNQFQVGSEYGSKPPTSSIQRMTSRPGSQSQAILSQMAAANNSSSNNQTITNGQPTIESEFRSKHNQSTDYQVKLNNIQVDHHQTSPRGGHSVNPSTYFHPGQQLQRDNLKQREEDLEERYRQLQGYSQSQLGQAGDQKNNQRASMGDNGVKDLADSETNPSIRFSQIRHGSQASQQQSWNPKQAWGRPASASMSQTDRPQQPPSHDGQQSRPSYIGDDISCSQNTHTVRLNHIINGQKPGYAQSEHGKFGQMTTSTRQPQIENNPGGSQSQTEAENPEPGINYDKNYLTGEVGPYPLHIPSGSIAGSQSQQSPSKHQNTNNQAEESSRDLRNEQSESQSNQHEHPQQPMNEDSMMQYYENENHLRKMSIGQRESEKMLTGSFQTKDPSDSVQAIGVPDMKNVTAMLQRAINYKVEEQSDSQQKTVNDFKMKVQDGGRNDQQYGVGTRETYLSKTTEITRMGQSQSNSCILEKPGADASTISVNNHQDSRADIFIHQNQANGEEKLQQELERIQQQKQFLSSYLPKDHQSISPRQMNQQIQNVQQVQPTEANQRDNSNSSFGRIYGNNEMNFSSKFGRNFQDQYSYSKSPGQDTKQTLQGQFGQQDNTRKYDQVPSQTNLNNGPDAQTSSKDIKSGYLNQNTTSHGQFTSSSQFGMRAGEQDIPREVFNYRDLSQDASRRSRFMPQGTDRPITYPTNMTNITHGDCVSPESSNQVYRRDVPQSNQAIQQMNNGASNKGMSWRIEKSDHHQPQQPYHNQPSDGAYTSQERYPLNSKGDMYQPQEMAVRSKSREIFGSKVDSPSVKRRQGMSPLSQSSRAKELQNSGLALLKKTTALLKNPPAVSNYKALNFEQDDLERAPLPEPKTHLNDSTKVFDSNASRKGVILNLFRKNSQTSSFKEKESDYNRRIQNQSYKAVVSQNNERKLPFGQSSIYTKNSEARASSSHAVNCHLESRTSSKFESANIKKMIPPKAYDQDRDTGSTRIGLKKSESEDRIGTQSHGHFRGHGKLTLGFLKQLKGNNPNEKITNNRSISEIKSDKRRSSNASVDLRNSRDNADMHQNMSVANRASSIKGESDTGCHVSSRTFTDANQSSHNASRSVTSKINRYKKFERELEQQKAQLEAIEKRNKEREAAKAIPVSTSATKDYMSSSKNQSSQRDLSNRAKDYQTQPNLTKKLSREQEIKQLYEIESKKVLTTKQSEQKLSDNKTQVDSRVVQKSSIEYGTIPEIGSINQKTVSPNRTFDSHRGSNFTLGNKIQASGEPSPTIQALKAQKSWNDEIRPIDQKSSSNEKNLESLSKSHGMSNRKNQYSGTFAMQAKPDPNNKTVPDMPNLHFNYSNVQRGPLNAQSSNSLELSRINRGPPESGARNHNINHIIDDKRSPNISYMQTTYMEEDSLARAERSDIQDKLPSQIHENKMLQTAVGSHLADRGTPRDLHLRNYNASLMDVQRAWPNQGEADQKYQHFNQLKDNKYRSKSHTLNQRQGASLHQVPISQINPQNQTSQVAEYISKNEMLRQQLYQRDFENVSNTQKSPLPTEGTMAAHNMNRTLSPLPGGSGTGPQATSPYSQFSNKQQPDLIPMRGPPSKAVDENRRRYHDDRGDVSPDRQPQMQNNNADLYQGMKSNFAKKIRDQSMEKQSNEGAQQQQVYMNIKRKEYVEQRDPLSFGRANDSSNQGESTRQQSAAVVNMDPQEVNYQQFNNISANDLYNRAKSNDQMHARSRVDAFRYPTETGNSSYYSYIQTQKEQTNNPQSIQVTSSTPQANQDYRSHFQPPSSNTQPSHQNPQHYFYPNTAQSINQFQYTNQTVSQNSNNQQNTFIQHGNLGSQFSHEMGNQVETPVLQGQRKSQRNEDESRVSTLKMVTAKQQQWQQPQSLSQTQHVPQQSNVVSKDGSRVTLSSNNQENCYNNQGQKIEGYYNQQIVQLPSNQKSMYIQDDSFPQVTGTGSRTIPSNVHKFTEFITTEQQTIGSIIRSPQNEVTSQDLANEQIQTATLSKNQEPSMAQKKSIQNQKMHNHPSQICVTGEETLIEQSQSEQGDIRKLIKLQFEQARMLMDLQKQLMQCQDFEKAAHLDSMDQSISRNFQGDITQSSQRPQSTANCETFNRGVPIEVASSVAALVHNGAASQRPLQGTAEGDLNDRIEDSQQYLPNLEHDQVNINYVMDEGQCYRHGNDNEDDIQKRRRYSQNHNEVTQSQPTHSHTHSKHSLQQNSHLKKLKQVKVKKNQSQTEVADFQPNQRHSASVSGTSPSKHSKQSSQALLKSSNSQAATNLDQPTQNQALSQHPRATRSHLAKGSAALSHASSIAIPTHNGNVINSNRSIHSVISKQSQQLQMSQISQQKASTLALIQKIYKQMEKIDEQISHKEKVDEQRYREMERKMRKLWKRYTKVKQDNDNLNQQSSQLLSLQPSQRFQVRSLAIDAGASSCDFEGSKQNDSKIKSTKNGSKQEKKMRHRSKGDLGKQSIMSDFQKPFSSTVENHTENKTLKSTYRQDTAARNQHQPANESDTSAIRIVEHDSRHYQNNINKSECRDINSNSGLSHVVMDHGMSRGGNAASKLNQVSDLLVDEPLHAGVSDCTSVNLKDEVNNVCDQTQQFPSEKRSHKDTDMSATSEAPLRQDCHPNKFGENPSFGAQYPSVNGMSANNQAHDQKSKKKKGNLESERDKGQSRVSSLSTSGLFTKINNQIMDASSLQINSMQSQYSNSHNQAGAHPPPTNKSNAHKQSQKQQRHHTSGNDIPSVSSRTHNNQREKPNIAILGQTSTIMRSHILENMTDAEINATETTCKDKDSKLKLGSSSGIVLAEETLQIQQLEQDVQNQQLADKETIKQVKGAIEEVKNLTNNQSELENQIQFMNGAISQLKEGYQQQIESMKQFYQEQINQLKQEVSKKERSQSRGRAAQSSGMGTPAAAMQNRMKSLSNENILNLTNLSMSASERKTGNNQNQNTTNKDPSPTKVSSLVSPIMHSNPQPLRMTPKQNDSRLPPPQQQNSQSLSQSVQPSLRNIQHPPELTDALALPGGSALTSHTAIAKLMDLRKFYETMEQLNEAVSQKEKLEEKLQKIKEKVNQAKTIRSKQQDRGSRERNNSKKRAEVQKPVDTFTGDDSCSLQIMSREAEVMTNTERTRDYEESDERRRRDQKRVTVNPAQSSSMYIEDEMAALSGVTLSDLPARDAQDESSAPAQTTTCRDDSRNQKVTQQLNGSQLSHSQQQNMSGTVERQKNDSLIFSQVGENHPNQMTPQGLPPISGSRSDVKNNLRNSVQRQSYVDRQSTKQTAEFTHTNHYSSQNTDGALMQQNANNRSNMSYISNQNSLIQDLGRGNQPLEHSFNLNYFPNELMQANSGHQRNQMLNQKSYESQPAGTSIYSVGGSGSVTDNSKSTDNLISHGMQRPLVSAQYGGVERFMQPYIPGGAKQPENIQMKPQQHFHHSTALAPGLVLLEQNSTSQMGSFGKEQLQTIQQQTMQDNIGAEGLSEIYLRDTTQQSMAAGASHSQQHQNSTLESSMQQHALLDQQNRRGIYQKIVGLQSMYHNQSQASSYNPAQQYGHQNFTKSAEYKYPLQMSVQQPQIAGAGQPYYIASSQGLGNGISPISQTNSLSFSMPNTRMDTINADSQANNNNNQQYIMRQDQQQDVQKRMQSNQQHVNSSILQDRRNTSPIVLKRIDPTQPYMQNSAGDIRSRQITTQQMTAPNITYPTATAASTNVTNPFLPPKQTPIYLQPYPQQPISLKPSTQTSASGIKAAPVPPQPPTVLHQTPTNAIYRQHQMGNRSPSPTLQPRIAGAKGQFGQPQQLSQQQLQGYQQPGTFQIDPRFLNPSAAPQAPVQKKEESGGKRRGQVGEGDEEGEEISYTMHSSTIEGTSQSEQTSRATSEMTSSYPGYSQRSCTEQSHIQEKSKQKREHQQCGAMQNENRYFK